MWSYVKNVLIGVDQLLNAIFCGAVDETLSSRAYRLDIERGLKWPRFLIDALLFFDRDHCYQSYLSEIERKQLPPSMRDAQN